MNEVGTNVAPVIYSPNNTSLKGAESVEPDTGKILPVKNDDDSESKEETPYPNGIRSAVAEVNSYVQSIQRDLQFDVDKDLEQTVIRVIDSNSGDVIRQIPEDIFLELARRLDQGGEIHLVDDLG